MDKSRDDELENLIGRMHESVMDTEASGVPAGNLYDAWLTLRAVISRSKAILDPSVYDETDQHRAKRQQPRVSEEALGLAKHWADSHSSFGSSLVARTLARELLRLSEGQREDGMVSVPMEPTKEMLVAGARAWGGVRDQHSETIAMEMYNAMLTSAPSGGEGKV